MVIIYKQLGKPDTARLVLTYADGVRIANWKIKNEEWAEEILTQKIAAGKSFTEMDAELVAAVFEEAGIPMRDHVPAEPDEMLVAAGVMEPDEPCFIAVPHVPSEEELKEAAERLHAKIKASYKRKEKAVRILNPPVTKLELINGKYYAVANIEDMYHPHVPATEEEIRRAEAGEIQIVEAKQQKQDVWKGRPYKVSQEDYVKAVDMLKRLIGEDEQGECE